MANNTLLRVSYHTMRTCHTTRSVPVKSRGLNRLGENILIRERYFKKERHFLKFLRWVLHLFNVMYITRPSPSTFLLGQVRTLLFTKTVDLLITIKAPPAYTLDWTGCHGELHGSTQAQGLTGGRSHASIPYRQPHSQRSFSLPRRPWMPILKTPLPSPSFHLDRLIVHNRKDLVLLLPLGIGHLIVPLSERERSGSYRPDCHDRRTVIFRLLGVIWKETVETFRRLPQPALRETDRGNCSRSLLLLLLGQKSLMIHLEGTLLALHHRLGTGTPLRSRLTQGRGGLLQNTMRIGSLGPLRPIAKASRLQWIERVDKGGERQEGKV